LAIWGQWIYENKISEKFKLTYSGKPSLFEANVSPPKDIEDAELQVFAADQTGNIGIHTITFRVTP
jgi:hypothetical protein